MDADGVVGPTGIRQFVVGTGGTAPQTFGADVAANSETRIQGAHGVLKLTLRPDRYDWEFLAANGAATDSGSERCAAAG